MVIIKIIILVAFTLLLTIWGLVLHRISTILKWVIKAEKEARKQAEFWDEYT